MVHFLYMQSVAAGLRLQHFAWFTLIPRSRGSRWAGRRLGVRVSSLEVGAMWPSLGALLALETLLRPSQGTGRGNPGAILFFLRWELWGHPLWTGPWRSHLQTGKLRFKEGSGLTPEPWAQPGPSSVDSWSRKRGIWSTLQATGPKICWFLSLDLPSSFP